MPLVKSDLSSALKNAFEKIAKEDKDGDTGMGVFTSPKAAKEIAKAYDSYASQGMAATNTVAASPSDFESGMLSAPTPAGLDAGLMMYWGAMSVSPGAGFASCVTMVSGPLGFSFANHKTSQEAADALADALDSYTTSMVMVTAVTSASPPVTMMLMLS